MPSPKISLSLNADHERLQFDSPMPWDCNQAAMAYLHFCCITKGGQIRNEHNGKSLPVPNIEVQRPFGFLRVLL